MKILQVNVVYKKGSTGKIVYDIHKRLQEKNVESVVCYGRGQGVDEDNVYKTSTEILAKSNALRSRITGLQYNGSFFATDKLINIIKVEEPDIVHLHCINGYFVNIYELIRFLKNNNYKTVLTLHAEFMYTGSCGHALECTKWREPTGCNNCPMLKEATNSYFFDRTHTAWEKMRKAFEGFDNLVVVSVSPWLMKRAKQSVILSNKRHFTVLNGIDTGEVFQPRNSVVLRNKLGLKSEKIILHVTASFTSDFKGGKYIVELAKRLSNDNIKIIVIGNNDKTIDLPPNIIDVGRIEDQRELAAYYSMADITVIASKRETFSMVCAESLACGTPVVGFRAGAPEEISIEGYSEFVEHGDMEELVKVVDKWINKKVELTHELESTAVQKYSKENMVNSYLNIYSLLINKCE